MTTPQQVKSLIEDFKKIGRMINNGNLDYNELIQFTDNTYIVFGVDLYYEFLREPMGKNPLNIELYSEKVYFATDKENIDSVLGCGNFD